MSHTRESFSPRYEWLLIFSKVLIVVCLVVHCYTIPAFTFNTNDWTNDASNCLTHGDFICISILWISLGLGWETAWWWWQNVLLYLHRQGQGTRRWTFVTLRNALKHEGLKCGSLCPKSLLGVLSFLTDFYLFIYLFLSTENYHVFLLVKDGFFHISNLALAKIQTGN